MKKDIDIAVILPTRGLVFTQVEEAIEKMRKDTWHELAIYHSHDKPIPTCLNELVQEALSTEATHFLFIEEDTVPPDGVLQKFLNVSQDIAFVDYGVAGWSCSARNMDDEILWCGFGCTMVKRDVFYKVEYPWFRSDKQLRLNDNVWIDVDPKKQYGGHDIWFFSQAREKGATFIQIEGECVHLELKSLGKKEYNNGLHLVSHKKPIEKYQIINFDL